MFRDLRFENPVKRDKLSSLLSHLGYTFEAVSNITHQSKNNIPPSESDEGAEGHGTVVFAVVTTVPCSGLVRKPSKSSELFEGSYWPERWNVVTTRSFETASL